MDFIWYNCIIVEIFFSFKGREIIMTFEELFKDKEPQDVLRKFYDISQIPRVPGDQKQISDYMVAWAKGLRLQVTQDKLHNVLVVKSASKDMESRPAVILQAHLDMVCEKDPGVVHDFGKDPLELRVLDGDKIMATGTTLGADDGIGVATIMAFFEDDSLVHPKIEALFTIDEETDMKGAWGFDCGQLTGRTLINLDSFAIMVAGSGELEFKIRFPKKQEKIAVGSKLFNIKIGGLIGGHTGQNSMNERGNAIMMVNRILLELEKEMKYQLVYMQGGAGLSSAFARNAEAIIAFAPEDEAKVREICERMLEVYKYELELRDPGVTVTMEEVKSVWNDAFAETTTDTLRTLLLLLPDGLFTINHKYKGAMESCSNVGVVETEKDEILVTILMRSFMENRKYYLLDKVKRICKMLGVKTEVGYDIPHWEYCVSDRLMDLAKEIYPDRAVEVAQGTLETGIFLSHIPDVEIIALSCPYYNAHSPQEYLLISEMKIYKERLKQLLAKF